jgi:MFS family permease
MPGFPHASIRDLLKLRAVRWTLATTFCWYLAAICMGVSLGIHVYDITGSKRDLGLLGLAEFLPTACLVLLTGGLADRFDRRRIVSISLAVEACVVASLIVITRSHPRTAAPFLAAMFVFGTVRAFNAPAMRSLTPAAAPPELLPRVVAVGSATWQFAAIGGPLLGAWCYRRSPSTSYAAAAGLIVAALICTRMIPAETGRAHLRADGEPEDKPTFRAAMQGLSTLWRNPILLGAIALDLFAVLFGGAVALLPAVAKDILGGDSFEVGVLRAAGGIGAVVVTIALATRPLERFVGRWLLGAVGVFGIATVVFGVSRSLILSAVALFILSGADAVSVFVRGTLVPLVTPAAERGRVLAVEAVFIGASNELGAFESGEVAHHFGTVTSIVSGGVLTLVVVALWWFVFRPLRNVDRFSDVMA